jgi:hypothetical protein
MKNLLLTFLDLQNLLNQIQINYSDVLRLVVVKKDEDLESNIIFFNELL